MKNFLRKILNGKQKKRDITNRLDALTWKEELKEKQEKKYNIFIIYIIVPN